MRRFAMIAMAALIGLIGAGIASTQLRKALEHPLLTQCLITGRLVFNKPIAEDLARSISERCRAGLERKDVLARRTPSLALMVLLLVTGARLLDPIHDLLALLFGGLAYAGMAVIWRAARPRPKPPSADFH